MNAEGRILTAARWISGANGTLGGAASTTGLGYGKSKWQRATEANRAVEYAIKGVFMALDGRVNQRHNSRELAHHLQRRGEDVGMAQLDDVEPQKGRTPTPYEEFENPEFKDLSTEQTGADTARRRDDCRQLRTTGRSARARAQHQGGTRGATGRLEPTRRCPGRTRKARGAQRPSRQPGTRAGRGTGPGRRRSETGAARTATSATARRGTTTAIAEVVGRTHSEAGGGPAGLLYLVPPYARFIRSRRLRPVAGGLYAIG